MDQREKEVEDIRRVLLIQESFSGKFPWLAMPHRRFVRNANATESDTKKPRQLFLFNDLLVVARPPRDGKSHVVDLIYLIDFSVYESQPVQLPEGGPAEEGSTLFLKTSATKYHTFTFASSTEKNSWRTDMITLQKSLCISLSSVEGGELVSVRSPRLQTQPRKAKAPRPTSMRKT